MITNGNYNVDHAEVSDKKIMFDFANEMCFDVRNLGSKDTRDNYFIRLVQLPAIMVSGVSTLFLPENPNEFSDRILLLLY